MITNSNTISNNDNSNDNNNDNNNNNNNNDNSDNTNNTMYKRKHTRLKFNIAPLKARQLSAT